MVKTVGIIGAGNIVFNAHLPVLLARGLDVRWLLDANLQRAQSVADAFGVAGRISPEGLSEAEEVDLILLTCPYGSRAPYYDYLRSRNSAIYVEKPFARDLAEWQGICSLRPAYAMAAGFQRRSMGVVKMVKQLIHEKIFGRLRRVRTEFGTATVASSGGEFAKNLKLSGGGQLFESAIHNVDAVCHLINAQDVQVTRCQMDHEDGFDLHTDASLVMTDEHGDLIEVELLVTCFQNTRYQIELVFDQAILSFSLFRPGAVEVRSISGSIAYQLTAAPPTHGAQTAYQVLNAFMTDFLNGIESRNPNDTNASACRQTTAAISQLYQLGLGSSWGDRATAWSLIPNANPS